MKLNLLTALLGIASIEMHTNIFGNKKPVAKLDQEQLEAIENSLAATSTEADALTISGLKEDIIALNATETSMQETISAAFATAGLEAIEGQTPMEAIALLGATCKEYGEAKATHSFAGNNGEEKEEGDGMVEGYINPKDEHSKFFN